jgi:hypothetical protein
VKKKDNVLSLKVNIKKSQDKDRKRRVETVDMNQNERTLTIRLLFKGYYREKELSTGARTYKRTYSNTPQKQSICSINGYS